LIKRIYLFPNSEYILNLVTSKIKISYTTSVCPFLLFCYSHVASAQTPSYIHYSVPEGLPSSEVYDVYQDKKGFVWFATDNGVAKYDGNQLEIFQVNEGLTDPVVFGIVEDLKGRIWFRTFSGKICYYNNNQIYPYQFNVELSNLSKNSYLFSLQVDSLDNVWFGVGQQIGKIDATGSIEKAEIGPFQLHYLQIEGQLLVGHPVATHLINQVKTNNDVLDIPSSHQKFAHPLICSIVWKGEKRHPHFQWRQSNPDFKHRQER
jgi:ligand-binding sensor domain-containing protein